MTFDQLTLN